MMIPPVVRLGYPTEAQYGQEFVVLHREFAWIIVTKSLADGYFKWKHNQDGLTVVSPIHFSNILCWMPQDGT